MLSPVLNVTQLTACGLSQGEARACLLPTALYEELLAKAGPTYVFERFTKALRAVYRAKGNRYAANAIKEFAPKRLKRWIQDAAKAYFDTTKAPHFKLRNFRGTAMSKARLAGISYDDAAVAFDCDPRVMQQHYAAFDKASVADRVFGQIQNGSERGAQMGSRTDTANPKRPGQAQMGTARPTRPEMGAHVGARTETASQKRPMGAQTAAASPRRSEMGARWGRRRRPIKKDSRRIDVSPYPVKVRETGLEPARPCGH